MMNEGEPGPDSSSNGNVSASTNTGPIVTPSQNVYPHSANKIKKPRGAPKASEIIIFALIIVGFAVLMSWARFRCFINANAAGFSAFATIAVMVLTAFYVVFARSQWIVMEDQLQALQDQIKVTRDSIELQKIHLQQWLEITNWRGGNTLVNGDMKRRWVETHFDIINPTSNPLTLTRITITIRGERSDQSFQHLLIPKDKYSSEWIIQLTPQEAENFMMPSRGTKPLVFRVVGEVAFIDALDKQRVQPFRLLAIYEYGSPVRIDTKWG